MNITRSRDHLYSQQDAILVPRKSNSDSAKRDRSKGKHQGNKQAGKGKEKKSSNPWAYKETLPILNEHDKCSLTDLAMLNCCLLFTLKNCMMMTFIAFLVDC